MSMINTWPEFARQVRAHRQDLLRELVHYPDAVLVAGCQRSGTTMLSRVFMHAPGFMPYHLTHDNELDAALLLSGEYRDPMPVGRYCFQTTYLNECWQDYARMDDSQRLIWVLRRPDSVVWSMAYHWKPFGREELYACCGKPVEKHYEHIRHQASCWQRWRYRSTWQACMAYIGKTRQLAGISRLLGDRLKVVDYDALVSAPLEQLPPLFAWLDVPFDASLAGQVRASSLKRSSGLKGVERAWVQALCQPVYDAACDRYL